jgi:hypothetical protein
LVGYGDTASDRHLYGDEHADLYLDGDEYGDFDADEHFYADTYIYLNGDLYVDHCGRFDEYFHLDAYLGQHRA